MRRARNGWLGAVAVASVALTVVGCAGQAGKGRSSRFLGDYAKLRTGDQGQGLMVYVVPQARFGHYRKVFIDPITIWHSTETDGIPAIETQSLIDDLADLLRLTLDDDYEVVETSGPDVLRVRAALTEAEGSWRVVGDLSDQLDEDLQAVMPEQPSGEMRGFFGKAGIEAELLDSMTSARLAVAVDRHVGAPMLSPEHGSWDDVENAFRAWAERLRDRLRDLRRRG